nr:shikimate dehydrogenase [Actibacterium sp. 188UL27-1]
MRAGLIGENISRTRLPAALQIMCNRAGLHLEFELIDTADRVEFDLAACVDDLRQRGWSGVTVTHPWKRAAAQYAGPGMAEDVAHLGAANLLVFGDTVAGFNTDYSGFLSAWRAQLGQDVPGRVAMAGAGGVARALGPALQTLGALHVVCWDVSLARAQDLTARLSGPATALKHDEISQAVRTADGVVNATPIGMAEHPGSAFDSADLGGQSWAFDAVYTPVDTAFLQDANAAGLRILTGFDLFRHMALRSFQTYTGVDLHPDEIMPHLLRLQPV